MVALSVTDGYRLSTKQNKIKLSLRSAFAWSQSGSTALLRLWSPLNEKKSKMRVQVTDYLGLREDTKWVRARLPAHPG